MDRLQRLDEAFEHAFSRIFPASWDMRARTPATHLIGGGMALIAVALVLLVAALVSDYRAESPVVVIALGLLMLSLGVSMHRRAQKTHDR